MHKMKKLQTTQTATKANNFSLTAAELRLNKDLLELKQYRITTKLFKVEFSNILKDHKENKFMIIVSMENITRSEVLLQL